jgi:hypothetical protein
MTETEGDDRDAEMATPTLRKKFHLFQYTAEQRGIPVRLSFADWWQLWLRSGHWDERGPHRGQYVLSRYDGYGAYELGNVHIIRKEDAVAVNNKKPEMRRYGNQFARGYRHSAETRARMSASHIRRHREVNP